MSEKDGVEWRDWKRLTKSESTQEEEMKVWTEEWKAEESLLGGFGLGMRALATKYSRMDSGMWLRMESKVEERAARTATSVEWSGGGEGGGVRIA